MVGADKFGNLFVVCLPSRLALNSLHPRLTLSPPKVRLPEKINDDLEEDPTAFAGKQGGLDRVRFTGKMVVMPKGLRIKSNGIEIDFTAKLDKELAEDRTSYSIRSSNIRWTHGYGSGDQDKKTYEVKSAKLLGEAMIDLGPLTEQLTDIGGMGHRKQVKFKNRRNR